MAVPLMLVVAVVVVAAVLAFRLMSRVEPQVAHRLVERGALLVDLQGRLGFNAGHLPEAKNIPLEDLPRRMKELGRRDRTLVVYGLNSTNRSALRILRAAGYLNVHDLGPMSRWGSPRRARRNTTAS